MFGRGMMFLLGLLPANDYEKRTPRKRGVDIQRGEAAFG
jgi:hypothetical protein